MLDTGCTVSPNHLVNRRCEERYPVSAELKFRMIRSRNSTHPGVGVNLSSSGILFWTPEVLQVGDVIELRVLWPGTRRQPIVLYLLGQTVRVEGNYTAVEIWKQEFGLNRAPMAEANLQ
jgi:hypothetical protein